MKQAGFFEIEDCYARLDAAGDPLSALDAVVDWSGLETLMRGITFAADNNGGKGGRPPLSGLMMAKILILQACNNLADDRAEVKVTFKNIAYNMQRFAFLTSRRRQHSCA